MKTNVFNFEIRPLATKLVKKGTDYMIPYTTCVHK